MRTPLSWWSTWALLMTAIKQVGLARCRFDYKFGIVVLSPRLLRGRQRWGWLGYTIFVTTATGTTPVARPIYYATERREIYGVIYQSQLL